MRVTRTPSSEEQRNFSYLPRDRNYNFLKEVSELKKQSKHLDFQKLKNNIGKIKEKIKQLDIQERQLWQQTLFNKIRQLSSKYKQILIQNRNNITISAQNYNQLVRHIRQSLYTLVIVCVECQIQYKAGKVEEIIKYCYFEQYGEEIVYYFESVGFDCSNYWTLNCKRKCVFECCLLNNTKKAEQEIQIID